MIMNPNLPQKIDSNITVHFHRFGYKGIRRVTPRKYDRITYSLSVFEIMSGAKKTKKKTPIPHDQFEYTKLVHPIPAMTVTIFRTGKSWVRANPYVVTSKDCEDVFTMLWRDAEKNMEMV